MEHALINENVLYLLDRPTNAHKQKIINQDRRQNSRLSSDLRLYSSSKDPVILKDISHTGLRFISSRPYPQGQLLALSLTKSLSVPIQVRWHKDISSDSPLWETGAQFSDFSEADNRTLKYLLYCLQEKRNPSQIRFVPINCLANTNELEKIIESIKSHVLTDIVQNQIEQCTDILHSRASDLWKWCQEGLLHTTLSSVPEKWREFANIAKMLSIILFTAIDDIADQLKNKALLQATLLHLFSGSTPRPPHLEHDAKTKALLELWGFIKNFLRLFPRYAELKDLFYFDYYALMHGVTYAMESNENPSIINHVERFTHQSYESHIVTNAMIDLMCSETFDKNELGQIREITWNAQQMCRITNWIFTWEREIQNFDFTSGIVSLALSRNLIKTHELLDRKQHEKIINRIKHSTIESECLVMWEECWTNISNKRNQIKSFEVASYLKGIERFHKMQYACRRLI